MIQTIFGSPVVVIKLDNYKELFTDEMYKESVNNLTSINNHHENSYIRGGKGLTANLENALSKDINRLGLFYDSLRQYGLKYSFLFSKRPIKDLKLFNSVVNLFFYGAESKNHTDARYEGIEKSLSILFYPKVPKMSAELVFIHNSKSNEWVSDREEKDLIRLHVEEGNLIIFDNYLLHAVGVHNSVDPRMSIHSEFDFVYD